MLTYTKQLTSICLLIACGTTASGAKQQYLVDIVTGEQEGEGLLLRTMTLQNGTKYECVVPREAGKEVETAEENEGRVLKLRGGSVVNEALSKKCLVKFEGWWVYEYCHAKFIRQYHQDEVSLKIVMENFLGMSPTTSIPSLTPTPTSLTVQYSGGTACDLTHSPRSSTVIYTCLPSGSFTESTFTVDETSICTYTVTIHVPQLCPFVRPPSEVRDEVISCKQVDP
eukprot:TRINITY_DN35561_c0_g1_i1.p1 TRINITY_DN35561_c0_g1~~TRINITY_DN35561_c0_g1_i1.p1  ORF type:complete len:244 (+),score=41.30 TRINITY_DN35561_c0_g1_i1:56-733(+)